MFDTTLHPQPIGKFATTLLFQVLAITLLAIPWTVQTIKTQIQTPSIIVYKPTPPPVEVVQKTSSSNHNTANGPTAPTKTVRVFHLPDPNAPITPTTISVIDDAPPATTYMMGNGPAIQTIPGGNITTISTLPFSPPIAKTATKTITVGGKVQAAKLMQKALPIYPALAKQARVSGTVLLDAVIGTDGHIQELHTVSGHPLLVPEALRAVRQWIYAPTTLNDQPVSVRTTIEVHFTLSN
jgi:protein TonB